MDGVKYSFDMVKVFDDLKEQYGIDNDTVAPIELSENITLYLDYGYYNGWWRIYDILIIFYNRLKKSGLFS